MKKLILATVFALTVSYGAFAAHVPTSIIKAQPAILEKPGWKSEIPTSESERARYVLAATGESDGLELWAQEIEKAGSSYRMPQTEDQKDPLKQDSYVPYQVALGRVLLAVDQWKHTFAAMKPATADDSDWGRALNFACNRSNSLISMMNVNDSRENDRAFDMMVAARLKINDIRNRWNPTYVDPTLPLKKLRWQQIAVDIHAILERRAFTEKNTGANSLVTKYFDTLAQALKDMGDKPWEATSIEQRLLFSNLQIAASEFSLFYNGLESLARDKTSSTYLDTVYLLGANEDLSLLTTSKP